MSEEYWIHGSVKHKGRVRHYLKETYGAKAFDAKGDIKMKYLNKAIKKTREEGETNLEEALNEAKTLKKIAMRKRRKMLIKV